MIRAYIKNQKDWDLNLGCLAGAYRATPHEATSLSPNLMILGREVRSPIEVALLAHTQIQHLESPAHYVTELRERLFKAHEVAREHLKSSANRQKSRYDSKVSTNHYKVGSLVWVLNEKRAEGVCQKLQPVFEGPAIIMKKVNDWIYEIQLNKSSKKVLHHDKLKPYIGTMIPKWLTVFQAKVHKDIV